MLISADQRLNRPLESFWRPEWRIAGRSWHAFQVCGALGIGAGAAVGLRVAAVHGVSLGIMGAVVGLAVLTLLGVAMVTKIVVGDDQLTFYHHALVIVAASAVLVSVLGQPVPAYLDAAVLGLGTFLAFGRLGCWCGGCCYGRPHRWGLRYTEQHAAAGFPTCYVGVRLLPVQVIESLWLALLVLVSVLAIGAGAAPGYALAVFAVGSSLGRLVLELARGDPERPYLAGVSEAQWTSLLVIWAVTAASFFGLLPAVGWELPAAVSATAVVVVLVVRERRGAMAHRLEHPRHLFELAQALAQLRAAAEKQGDGAALPPLKNTSLGLRISASRHPDVGGSAEVYALSMSPDLGALSPASARTLAGQILQLTGARGEPVLISGNAGLYYLAVRRLANVN